MNKFISICRTRSHHYHSIIIIIIIIKLSLFYPSFHGDLYLIYNKFHRFKTWFKFSIHKVNSIPSLPHHHQASSFTIHSSHLSTSSSHLIPKLSFLLSPFHPLWSPAAKSNRRFAPRETVPWDWCKTRADKSPPNRSTVSKIRRRTGGEGRKERG